MAPGIAVLANVTRRAPLAVTEEVTNSILAARLAFFEKNEDYAAFERVLEEPAQKHLTRTLAFCVMPNDCRLVLWPRREGHTGKSPGKAAMGLEAKSPLCPSRLFSKK